MTKRLWLFISIPVIAIVAVLGIILWQHHNNDIAAHKQTLRTHVKQVGISPSSSAKESTITNTPTPAKTPDGTGAQQSNSTDTNGSVVANTSKSQWTTSESGNLTLQQPVADATLTSGSVLSGTSKVAGPISYRLSDNSVGVLTQGTLNVVNGKFSGTLNFTHVASTGQLDIFTTNSQGLELDEIQVGVTF